MKVLVFDIGDVLIRLNRPAREQTILEYQLTRSLPLISYRDISTRWSILFATGQIGTDRYLKELSKVFNVPASIIHTAEETMLESLNTDLIDFIYHISQTHTVACLSNNHPIHWSKIQTMFDTDCFRLKFLSQDTGLLKPDIRAYTHALSTIGVDSHEVFFIDDEVENISGAETAGWKNTHRHVDNSVTIDQCERWLK